MYISTGPRYNYSGGHERKMKHPTIGCYGQYFFFFFFCVCVCVCYRFGRLNHPTKMWTSKGGDGAPWIRADLSQVMLVTGVITQGKETTTSRYCVRGFRVKTGRELGSFSFIQDGNGATKVLGFLYAYTKKGC